MGGMKLSVLVIVVALVMSSFTAEGRRVAAGEKQQAEQQEAVVDDDGVVNSLDNHHACSMADFSRGTCDPAWSLNSQRDEESV